MSRRSIYRWLVSFAFLGVGLLWVHLSPDLVLRGTPIPVGYLFALLGALGVFCCLLGINVFKGGPLDMHDDPPLDRP